MPRYVPVYKFKSARVTCFILVLFLAGCTVEQPVSPAVIECETFRKFYIVGHDWHTGIVVSRDDLVESVMPLAADFSESKYVEIGWGDEKFYQAEAVTPGLALQAILWPTSTVLHLVGLTKPPQDYFSVSEVLEISVPQGGYENLMAYIAKSFTRTEGNDINRLGPGLYGESRFYRATGEFHAFNTCNSWVARAIEETGYPIDSSSVTRAEELLSRLRRGLDMKMDCFSVHRYK